MKRFLVFTPLIFFLFISDESLAAGGDQRAYNMVSHIVQPKETIYKISRQYGVSMVSIKNTNKLSDNTIGAGQKLTIPVPKENDYYRVHIVRVSENVASLSETYTISEESIYKFNDLDDNFVFPGQRIFIRIDRMNTKYTLAGNEDAEKTDPEQPAATETGGNQHNNGVPDDVADQKKNVQVPIYTYKAVEPAKDAAIKRDTAEEKAKAFHLEGFMDAYFARFSDKDKNGALNESPLSNPVNGQTGLNIAQLSAVYSDSLLRGNITLQYGDMTKYAYPSDFQYLQQANVGVNLYKCLWLDAGFFKSPVSVEDFPGKNNYTSMYSLSRYYEPVLMSGAKLGYENNYIKLTGFVADRHFGVNTANSKPAYGVMLKITPEKQWTIGANAMMSIQGSNTSRFYGNIYAALNCKHWDVLAVANMGAQQRNSKGDTLVNGNMFSTVLTLKYKFNKKFALYGRGEYFMDTAAILSKPMTATDGTTTGLKAYAFSAGFEFKAVKNHYLRIEARNTQLGNNFTIFPDYLSGSNAPQTNQRWEFVISTGFWFGN